MRLNALIQEIRELKMETGHKAALDVYRLLNNNKALFGQKMDHDVLNRLLHDFEALSDASPAEAATAGYKREYEKAWELLVFYLGRII